MQKFVEFSSVVDSMRSNAGSALKSVQRSFEETALKAAGLEEDEEALYRLNKRAQAYLRASDAMQQASVALAEDFADAVEDLALRDVARKFREASKSTAAQQLSALNREVVEPVGKACEGDNYGTRQRLISKAFVGLIDVNLECFRIASTLVEEVHSSAQAVLSNQEAEARPRAQTLPASNPSKPAPARTAATAQTLPKATKPPAADLLGGMGEAKAQPAPKPRRPSTDDLLGFGGNDDLFGGLGGGYSAPSKQSAPEKGHDLLDFGLGGLNVPSSSSGTSGTSLPPERASSSVPLDLDFGSLGSSAAPPPTQSPPAAQPPAAQSPGGGLLGGLGDISWPSKEDEDESCINARVAAWRKDKNLRTMLVALHEVAPASAGWQPVQLGSVVDPADVKSVYRRAVLAVHPDKHQTGKAGEKLLGHLVFEALRDEWNVYRTSG